LLQVAAVGSRDLWLTWIDALRDFEGSIGRHGLLGFTWDSNFSGELPAGLLRGSTLAVLGENPAWMVRPELTWLQKLLIQVVLVSSFQLILMLHSLAAGVIHIYLLQWCACCSITVTTRQAPDMRSG